MQLLRQTKKRMIGYNISSIIMCASFVVLFLLSCIYRSPHALPLYKGLTLLSKEMTNQNLAHIYSYLALCNGSA